MLSADDFRAIMNCMGVPVFVKDRQHRFVFVNDAARAFVGKPPDELLGKTGYESLPKEQADVLLAREDMVFETGDGGVTEERIAFGHGEVLAAVAGKTLCTVQAGERYIVSLLWGTARPGGAGDDSPEACAGDGDEEDRSPEGLFVGQDGLFRLVNAGFCKIFGYTRKEVAHRFGRDTVMPPRGMQASQEEAGSSPPGRQEDPVSVSRPGLSETIDLARIVSWEMDPARKTCVFNDPFYAFYGTTAGREGGYRMTPEDYALRFVHSDDRPLFRRLAKRRLADMAHGTPDDMEYRIVRRDGKVRYVLARLRVVRDDSDRVIRVYGINQDVTVRKRTKGALHESPHQFRKIFEESPFGMVMVSADFRYLRANATFCRMVGYSEQELTSLSLRDITHPDFIADDVARLKHIIRNRVQAERREKQYIRKDGGTVWTSVIVNDIRDRNGRFLYFLTTIEDITHRKQTEEEKRRLESQLFQSQKMEAVGTLAGGIAHDFNNILTALVGYAGLLKMKMPDSPFLPYVDQILSASKKATDLVQSLLSFSKQRAINPKPVSLHGIINGTEKLLRRLVTEDIALRTLLAPYDITILADATQIDQILFNLAANARDAMPQGGTMTLETEEVELDDTFRWLHGYGRPGRYALLSFSDTGVGMDEDTRRKIFDPFFSTKEAGKGTGLGLSTVYGIVKQHSGFITVYSEAGIGTTFHIYLPAVNEGNKREQPPGPPVKGGTETILIAEDNEAVRRFIIEMLNEYGYTTIEAVDGLDAVQRFKKADRVDLLILDSVMPNMNGRQTYNEIRRIKPDTRVIFTSGYTRDVFLDKGIEDRKFNFLQKPIAPPALLLKVREALDGESP